MLVDNRACALDDGHTVNYNLWKMAFRRSERRCNYTGGSCVKLSKIVGRNEKCVNVNKTKSGKLDFRNFHDGEIAEARARFVKRTVPRESLSLSLSLLTRYL